VQAEAEIQAQPFFSRGINSGAASSAQASVQQHEEEVQEPLSALAARLAAAHSAHVRMQHAVDAPVAPSSSSSSSSSSCAITTDTGAPAAAMRHVQQNRALTSALGAHALLDPSCTFVEVGAGKAMLSLSISDALPPCSSTAPSAPHRFLLVERDAPGGMHNKVAPSVVARVQCKLATLTHSLTAHGLSACHAPAGGPHLSYTRSAGASALRRATHPPQCCPHAANHLLRRQLHLALLLLPAAGGGGGQAPLRGGHGPGSARCV
jgi:hypothetical protein